MILVNYNIHLSLNRILFWKSHRLLLYPDKDVFCLHTEEASHICQVIDNVEYFRRMDKLRNRKHMYNHHRESLAVTGEGLSCVHLVAPNVRTKPGALHTGDAYYTLSKGGTNLLPSLWFGRNMVEVLGSSSSMSFVILNASECTV